MARVRRVDGLVALRRKVKLALARRRQHKARRQFAEIDLRPGDVELHVGRGRQVLHPQHRQALRGHLVGRCQGEPHPVREREVLVHERAGGQRRGVELARRQHHVAQVAVHRVAVVVHGHEIVVRPDGLELPEGLQQRLAVPEPHVVNGGAVVLQVGGRELLVGLQLAPLDRVEPPGAPRGGDVMGDLRRLARQLVGLHDQPLHHRGHHARERRGEDDVADHDEQERPSERAAPRAPDQPDRARHHQQREHAHRRHLDVQVRIARALQRPVRSEEQGRDADHLQPHGRQDEPERREDGQVQLGGPLDDQPVHPPAQVPAREIDRTRHRSHRQEHDAPREVQACLEGGQREHVVGDIAAKDRVGGAKRRAVHELEQRPPVTARPRRKHGRQQQRARQRRDLRDAREQPLPGADTALREHHDTLARSLDPAERNPRVAIQQEKGADARHQEQRPLRDDPEHEDPLEANLGEPHPVRDPRRDGRHREHDQEGHQHDDGDSTLPRDVRGKCHSEECGQDAARASRFSIAACPV